jgi:hypothetical protein
VNADTAIRISAVGAVGAVAGAAGWVSYNHALAVYVYPVFIDGMVYMSSMVLLMAARRKMAAPALAWWSLAIGITCTLGANVYSMASHGILGCIAGALPAAALVLSYELMMWIIRSAVTLLTVAITHTAPDDLRRRPGG